MQAMAYAVWSLHVVNEIGLNKHATRGGGGFHSGAPRLCLPCLPSRDAADSKTLRSACIMYKAHKKLLSTNLQ